MLQNRCQISRESVSVAPPSIRGTPSCSGPDALGDEHAGHVVVRDHQELRGVGEGQVVGQVGRLDMAVHADEGKLRGLAVQPAGDPADLGVDGQGPVRVQDQWLGHPDLL